MGHLNFRMLAGLHSCASGIPKIKQPHVSDNCHVCIEIKLRRSTRGHGTIANKASRHGQMLCADWGLYVKNPRIPQE
jgi:hypothetical protein